MHGYGNVLSFVHAHWLIFTYFKMHSVHCMVGSHAQSEFMQNVKFNIAGNVFQAYLFIIQSLKCVLGKYVFSYTKYYYKTLSLQLSHRSMVHPGALTVDSPHTTLMPLTEACQSTRTWMKPETIFLCVE